MKKLGIFGCVMAVCGMLMLSVCAVGNLSPAVDILQGECVVLKTGVGSNTVTFSEEDFLSVFGETDFVGIVITELPALSDGVLKLGALDAYEGQIVAKNAIKALRFVPSEAGKTASFGFLPYGGRYENDFVCTVYMLDSLNFAPTASRGTLCAMEGIPVYGMLSASDPEGDPLTYRMQDAPKKGRLTLNSDGSYRYLSDMGKGEQDRFTYVAIDPYGNRSEVCEVVIHAEENQSGIVYADIQDERDAHSAALLASKEALIGEKIGNEWYFYPEKTVTRGEFLMMAMKMNQIDVNLLAANDSGFADKEEFSSVENKYIAVAARLGLIVGVDTENGRCFLPDEVITSAQASTIISRMARLDGLALADAVLAFADEEAEISDEGMEMLSTVGLALSADRNAEITRADAARLLYQLSLATAEA